MNKPTIFFSHSSADQNVLNRLKDLFVEKTGGTIDVFLSSDGQSIPLGRNWVHRVQEALDEASVMVVFITPRSLRSSWIFFEAGYAYSKNIRVVPVGFLGTNLSSLAPPLSLLQGFNIQNEDGLDNLIALANEAYSHNHKNSFSEKEFHSIIQEGNKFANHPLGDFAKLIDEIYIEVTEKNNLICEPDKAIEISMEILDENNISYKENGNKVECFGLTISAPEGRLPKPLTFTLDPSLIESTVAIVSKILRKLRDDGVKDIPLRFDFIDNIDCLKQSHKQTARLYGTGVKLGDEYSLYYKKMGFATGRLTSFRGHGQIQQGSTYLSVFPVEDMFELCEFATLLEILFKNEVLIETDQWVEV